MTAYAAWEILYELLYCTYLCSEIRYEKSTKRITNGFSILYSGFLLHHMWNLHKGIKGNNEESEISSCFFGTIFTKFYNFPICSICAVLLEIISVISKFNSNCFQWKKVHCLLDMCRKYENVKFIKKFYIELFYCVL